MSDQIAICSVAFGDAYREQQFRLIKSISATNVGLHCFWYTDSYPPGSPTFEQSLYGFKVYAIKRAVEKGYKKIIWIDTACIVHGSLGYLFVDDMPPVVAVRDESKLSATISDKALAYYGNPNITGLNLVGGSLYAFNFNNPICEIIFNEWAKAEKDGIFGTMAEQISEQINKHRHDESCMAMALFQNGEEPVTPWKAKYCTGDESIVTKRHFK